MSAKKSFVILSVIVLVSCICGTGIAATQAQINEAIEKGVVWLAAQQNSSAGYWQDGGYRAGPTGLALIKLEERAFELGYTPFDPCYPYEPNVEKGLAYLFSQMRIISTPNQPAGNPDTDGDGNGVYVNSGLPIYETGIVMMAIAASRAPDRVVNSPGSPVHGWTYKQVLVDMVDYMAFGQCDSGSGRGGWRYSPNSGADNSCSGFAVSGLGYAETPRYGFNCTVPQFVKDELKIWIDYIQTDGNSGDGGGSGYTAPGSMVNILKTGNLVFQMTFARIPLEDPNMQRALAYIGRKWNTGWSGDCQAMYCTANGMWYSNINTIVVDGNERDWYADFADALVNTQQSTGYWFSSYGNVLGTEWALLALEMPTSGPRPPGYLELTKVDDVNDCVVPGDEITYTISYIYPWSYKNLAYFAYWWLRTDCNLNNHCNGMDINRDGKVNFIDFALFADNWLIGSINDVNLIDYLPIEVDYNSSDPYGYYDPCSRTVTWSIDTLEPNESGSVTLKVRVKHPEPGSTITNCCKIKSGDEVLRTAEENTLVCVLRPPTLTKHDNVLGCVVPDANIIYSICYAANDYSDTNVVIIDFLPDEVNYVSSDPCGIRDSNTIRWNIGTLRPNDSNCITLIVKVNEKAVPRGKITNCCRMTGNCININACENTSVCSELEALWEFDEGSGTIASDSVGSYNGTLLGDHPGDPKWVDSPHGGALEFDSNDCVEIGYHPVFNPTGSFSVSLWAYIEKWGPAKWGDTMIANRGDGDEGWALRYFGYQGEPQPPYPDSGALSFTTKDIHNVVNGTVDSGYWAKDSPSGAPPPLNEWVHIACVYDSINHKKYIYFDGEQNAVWDTDPNGKLYPAPQSLYIGARSDKGDWGPEACSCFDSYFRGKLDDVRFYLGVLSPEEIVPDYTQARKPNPYNNKTITTTNVTLTWQPGCGVPSADNYRVYFSDNRADVKSGAPSADKGTTGVNNFYGPVNNLVRGQTYYWRIDTVSGPNTYRGYIWKFYVQPQKAYDPDPCDFHGFAPVEPNLSWKAGVGATTGHNVYFGYTFNEVNNAPTGSTVPPYRTSLPTADTNWNPAESGLSPLAVNTTYYWRIDEKGPPIVMGDVWRFTTVPIAGLGSILCEAWQGILNADVNSLTSSMRYPDYPNETNYPTLFDDPTCGINYGTRMHGWLYVRDTNDYTFWIASEDNSELWLSTDDNPDNAVKIASVPGSTEPRQWTTYPAQRSSPKYLVAGNPYYIMALHKQDQTNYTDHMAVAWSTNPDPNTAQVIPGKNLVPYLQIPSYRPTPADGANDVESEPTLNWHPGKYTGNKCEYFDVYFDTDKTKVTDANRTNPLGVLRKQNHGSNSLDITSLVGTLQSGTTYYWRIDDVNNNPSAPPPHIWKSRVWSFTTGCYLVVEDFEEYANTTAMKAVWKTKAPATIKAASEIVVGQVHGGKQAMAINYSNTYPSEANAVTSGANSLGFGVNWRLQDVKALSLWYHGIPDLRGSKSGAEPNLTLNGDGSGFDGKFDVFYFLNNSYNQTTGQVKARVTSIENTSTNAMAGVMIRDTLDPNVPYAAVVVTPDNRIIFMGRPGTGASASPIVNGTVYDINLPHWVRITRTAGGITAEHANDVNAALNSWSQLGATQPWSIGAAPTYFGLCVTSHVYCDICTAGFSTVAMQSPINTNVLDPTTGTNIGGYVYNDPQPMYVVLQDNDSNGIWYYPGTTNHASADTTVTQKDCDWHEWIIDLNDFNDQGVNLYNVKKIYVGIGDKTTPSSGSGTMYIDDIRLYCDDLKIEADNWLIEDYEVTPVAPPTGPVAWYQLEKNANDSAGGRNGVEHGIKTADYVTDAKQGTYALDLKGDANYIGTGYTAASYGIDGKKARTITAWVYTRSFDEYAGIYEIGGNANGQEFSMLTNGNEPNVWRANHWGGPENWDIDFKYPSLNRWVHFAHVYDGTTVRVYADGYAVAERVLDLNTANAKTFSIGRWSYANYYFDGIIDDVRIYNYALSQANAAYLAGKTTTFTQPLELLLTPRQSQH